MSNRLIAALYDLIVSSLKLYNELNPNAKLTFKEVIEFLEFKNKT